MPAAPSAAPPNILFVFTDQHRWDWVGYEGRVPVRTPNLDRLAARGVAFSGCRVASPMCAPSRACLAAGVRYGRCRVADNRADADPALPTFMQSLRAAGYRVAMCGKSDLHKRSHLHGRYGWSSFLGRMGFTDTLDHAGHRDSAAVAGRTEPIEPYLAFLHEHGLAATVLEDWERRRRHDEDGKGIAAWPCPHARFFQIDDFTGRAALGLLDRLPAGQPWFLQVNFSGPHPYFDACRELLDRYDGVAFPEPAGAPPSAHDHQAIRRSYAAKIEGIDDWIGWIRDAVERRGEADRTLFAFSADHGEMLGERGLWDKGQPHEGSVRVPLAVSGPGVDAGRWSDAPVETIDLAATFVEAAGAESPAGWDACSLWPLLSGSARRTRPVAESAFGDWRLRTDGRWKLIERSAAAAELYDLWNDRAERHDVAHRHPRIVDRLRSKQGRKPSD